MGPCPGPVLFGAAGRRRRSACGRPPIPFRQRSRTAARLLARRDRLQGGGRQRRRRLSARANLRRHRLLGGVFPRAADRRREPGDTRRSPAYRRYDIDGGDAGFRAGRRGGPALGAGAALLLAGGRRRAQGLLVRAGDRRRPVIAHRLYGARSRRAADRVHAAQRTRSRAVGKLRAVGRRPRHRADPVSPPAVARRRRRRRDTELFAAVRRRGGRQ